VVVYGRYIDTRDLGDVANGRALNAVDCEQRLGYVEDTIVRTGRRGICGDYEVNANHTKDYIIMSPKKAPEEFRVRHWKRNFLSFGIL
jgi:hypothetical protein